MVLYQKDFKNNIKNNDFAWYWDNALYDNINIGWTSDKTENMIHFCKILYIAVVTKIILTIMYFGKINVFIYCTCSISKGDTIVLQYSSDLSILSFGKENDI